MTDSPQMSVVIVAGTQRANLPNLLYCLINQEVQEQVEIVLVDCGGPEVEPLPFTQEPALRILRGSPSDEFEEALVAGIRASRAPIVALLEEHCLVFPGWARALLRAHRGGDWAAVAGEQRSGNVEVGFSAAEAIVRGVDLYAPVSGGECTMFDGHNSVFRRDVLLSYGDDLPRYIQAEPVLIWKMAQDGFRFYQEPEARYLHLNETTLSTSHRSYFHWNRNFGHVRAAVGGWPWWRRLAFVAALPLQPWKRWLSTLFQMRHKELHPDLLNQLVALLLFHFAAAGMAVGVLFGPGSSPERFAYFERELVRPYGRAAHALLETYES